MRQIDTAAVLGAGVMGAAIAAHLANAGIRTLLLDMVPREPNEAERAAGLTLNDRAVRNRLAAAGLEGVKKAMPSPLFLPAYASAIEVGNFTDDMPRIAGCDWVIEAVVEDMAVKRQLLAEQVVTHLKEGTILSTNTSGLSVNEMAHCLPGHVRRTFLATHFFNPPRYMRLLEIVPCTETDPEVIRFMAAFLSRRLGKGIVHAKDTPNFIANRIGVYALANCAATMVEMGMTVEEVDAVAGPATARPRSAAFRTADLVGIDTLCHVAAHSYDLLKDDDERALFRLPAFIGAMVAKGLLGNKSRQGFFKKVKDGAGATAYLYYDYTTGDYAPSRRPHFPSIDGVRQIDDPAQRLRAVLEGTDRGAAFAWRNLRDTLIYAFKRIPEISGDIVNIDNAMKWGFNWELGPFEMLDAIGPAAFVARAEQDGIVVPQGLREVERFYRFEGTVKQYYSPVDKGYRDLPVPADRLSPAIIRQAGGVAEQNSAASVLDLGDGVFCLEFHSKMNTIGTETLAMIPKALTRAQEEGIGLVIANEGTMFSAGANLMLLVTAMAEGAFDEIALTVKRFQKAMMAIKYSPVPVVAAPHNLAMGGGCEVCLHSDAIVPHSETYMGLVEIGVGLLPAGGGTKEMAIRAIRLAEQYETDVQPFLLRNYLNIAMAKVSTSAAELYGMGYLSPGDGISMDLDRRIHDAKQRVMALAATYRPAVPLTGLKAPGRGIAASIASHLWNMRMGGFISEYDQYLATTIAGVITGGDVPGGTVITEEYLLELEREAFLRLCGQKKTQERIQHMLKKGKALRN